MNTYPVNTYQSSSDEIDVWCKYTFVDKEQDDGKSQMEAEWQGEMEITFAQNKLIKLTQKELSILLPAVDKFVNRVIDDAIEIRIKQLEQQQLQLSEKEEIK